MSPVQIEALLAPVSSADPCGPNLESGDAAFSAFDRATLGKPERQFGTTIIPAEEPDWKSVARQAIDLLARTKDLRVAVNLTKALLHTDGLRGLAQGLALLDRFVQVHWDWLHPRLDPDDGNDPTMRVNVLSTLTTPEVLAVVRATPLIVSRTMGRFSFKDIEGATAESTASIEAAGMDCDLATLQEQTSSALACAAALKSLDSGLAEVIGAGSAPSFGGLAALIHKIATFLGNLLASRTPQSSGVPSDGGEVLAAPASPASGEIRSREDVSRTLDRISAYYAKNEPSSPIPIFIERCKRLVMMSFVDIVRELAPDGIKQIELLSGRKE